MFGYAKIFRSRWWALFWAAGILWIAYDVAAPSDPASNEAAAADPDLVALQEAVNGM